MHGKINSIVNLEILHSRLTREIQGSLDCLIKELLKGDPKGKESKVLSASSRDR